MALNSASSVTELAPIAFVLNENLRKRGARPSASAGQNVMSAGSSTRMHAQSCNRCGSNVQPLDCVGADLPCVRAMRKPMRLLTLLFVSIACSKVSVSADASQQMEAADLPHKQGHSQQLGSEEALQAVDDGVGTLLEQ
jgi:hypothetical protein